MLSTWVAVVISAIIVPITAAWWFLIYEEDEMKRKDSQQEITQIITKRFLVLVLIGIAGLIVAVVIGLNSMVNIRINDANNRINRLGDVATSGSLAYKIEELKSSIADLKDILEGREGVLSRLSYIEGETRTRVPVEQSRKIPVSSVGGTVSLGFWNRELNFITPEGWLQQDSILTVTPYAVTEEEIQSLVEIGKYKPTKWSFEITKPKQFLEEIGVFTTYTSKDLRETGVSDPEDLILLQWLETEQKWKELIAEPLPATQQLKTRITGPGKYLLGAKVE